MQECSLYPAQHAGPRPSENSVSTVKGWGDEYVDELIRIYEGGENGRKSRNIDNNQRGCCPGKRQRRGDKKDLGKKWEQLFSGS